MSSRQKSESSIWTLNAHPSLADLCSRRNLHCNITPVLSCELPIVAPHHTMPNSIEDWRHLFYNVKWYFSTCTCIVWGQTNCDAEMSCETKRRLWPARIDGDIAPVGLEIIKVKSLHYIALVVHKYNWQLAYACIIMDGDHVIFTFCVLMAMSISSCSRFHVQVIMNKFMYHLVRVGGWLIITSDAVHVSMISPITVHSWWIALWRA